jgi:putative ABC transport system permease protein
MKYLPLVWAAFRRHATESLLTFLVLTIAFALFSSMVALKRAYDAAIENTRMDRLLVTERFCCKGLNIGRRAELMRIPGVRGVAVLQGVSGFYKERGAQITVWLLDAETIAAIPELRLDGEHWKRLQETRDGLFFARKQAEQWRVKAGDSFIIQTRLSGRQDGATSWPFTVLDVVDDSDRLDWMPNIYGNYDYFDANVTADQRGKVFTFVLSIDHPDHAQGICRRIDTLYANSEHPTYCVPLQIDARNLIASTVSMRQMSLGIGAAGLFMILFLCANSIAESVRERVAEFAILKTIGFGDRQVAALVFLEAAVPAVAGAVLGTALAGVLSSFTSQLSADSPVPIPSVSISPGIAGIALVAALVIGAASALLPLRRLQTMDLATVLTAAR